MSSASSYKKLKKLGKGSFGSVYLVQPTAGGEPLVMKEVSLRGLSRKERQATINEVSILKKVVHPNVIAYANSFSTADMLCICMEHAPGGDLTALISSKRRSGERFAESVVLKMAYELTSALSYFHHDLHLLHRDLKPQAHPNASPSANPNHSPRPEPNPNPHLEEDAAERPHVGRTVVRLSGAELGRHVERRAA